MSHLCSIVVAEATQTTGLWELIGSSVLHSTGLSVILHWLTSFSTTRRVSVSGMKNSQDLKAWDNLRLTDLEVKI